MCLRGRLSLLRGSWRREWLWWETGSAGDLEDTGRERMNIRALQRDEIPLVWKVDRREIIENIYYLRDGKLVLEPEHYDMQGWSPNEAEHNTPILTDCY